MCCPTELESFIFPVCVYPCLLFTLSCSCVSSVSFSAQHIFIWPPYEFLVPVLLAQTKLSFR